MIYIEWIKSIRPIEWRHLTADEMQRAVGILQAVPDKEAEDNIITLAVLKGWDTFRKFIHYSGYYIGGYYEERPTKLVLVNENVNAHFIKITLRMLFGLLFARTFNLYIIQWQCAFVYNFLDLWVQGNEKHPAVVLTCIIAGSQFHRVHQEYASQTCFKGLGWSDNNRTVKEFAAG